MNNPNDTVNKRDVKQLVSFVLLNALKFVGITELTPVGLLIDVMIAAAVRNTSIEQASRSCETPYPWIANRVSSSGRILLW